MFLSRFYQKEIRPFTSVIIYVLFFSFLLSVSGCETTKVSRESPAYLELFNNGKIQASQLILKDGSFIDVSEKPVYYYKKYKDTSDVLVFINFDTVKVNENGRDILRLRSTEKLVPLSNVQEVFITRTEFDAGMTVLLVLGIAVVAAITFLMIAVASYSKSDHKSCPYVYSYDGEKYVYDAEPLGGAVCEGLGRTDYNRLDYLKSTDGVFKILLRNENEEVQYLDEMKMLTVKHDKDKFVTAGQDNNFYQYSYIDTPLSVKDENGKDVTAFFTGKDNRRWQTDFPANLESKSLTEKHKLNLRFRKPAGASSAKLLFYGGTAEWGSKMVKEFLMLRGTKLDEWYKSVYPGSLAQKELYSFMLNEELYYLKVYLNENGTYKHEATIKGGGPKSDEEVLVDIPLSNINGDYLDIELNPPPGFWKFDRIAVVYDCEKIDSKDINVLDVASSKDDNGIIADAKLNSADKDYYVMQKVGSNCSLEFRTPESYNENEYALFLKTTGWYEIMLDKTRKPEDELLASFIKNPRSVLEYSQKLLIKDLLNASQKFNNLLTLPNDAQ